MIDQILSIAEVAQLLRMAEKTIYTIAQHAEPPRFKVRWPVALLSPGPRYLDGVANCWASWRSPAFGFSDRRRCQNRTRARRPVSLPKNARRIRLRMGSVAAVRALPVSYAVVYWLPDA